MKSPQVGEFILHKPTGCVAVFDSLVLDEQDDSFVEYFVTIPTTEWSSKKVDAFWPREDCLYLGMGKDKIIESLQK